MKRFRWSKWWGKCKRTERRIIVRSVGAHTRWSMTNNDKAMLADDVIGFDVRCPRSLRAQVKLNLEQRTRDAEEGYNECPF